MVLNMLRLFLNVFCWLNKLLVVDLIFFMKFEVKLCFMIIVIIIVLYLKDKLKGE